MELCRHKLRLQENDSLRGEAGTPHSDANWGTPNLYIPGMAQSQKGVSVLAWNESQIPPSVQWAASLWNFLVAWQQLLLRPGLSLPGYQRGNHPADGEIQGAGRWKEESTHHPGRFPPLPPPLSLEGMCGLKKMLWIRFVMNRNYDQISDNI